MARFTGDQERPALQLQFEFEQRHATTGALLREWVKDLPVRRWDGPSRTWIVTETGPDPDSLLAAAGFVVVGPDDQPCSLIGYTDALVEPDEHYSMTSVRPRLAGREHTREQMSLPDDAVWRESERRWLVRTARDTATASSTLAFDGTIDGLRGVDVGDLAACDPATVESLAKIGVDSVHDLLHRIPRRYLDRSNPVPVAGVAHGETAAFIGTVTGVRAGRTASSPTTVKVSDTEGTLVSCRWFRAGWIARRFGPGMHVLVHGKVETFTTPAGGTGYGMTNPVMDQIAGDDARDPATPVIAIYPQSAAANLSTWQLHRACKEAARRVGDVLDPVPRHVLARRGLVTRAEALRGVHVPGSLDAARASRDRLAYDELLRLQLVLATARSAAREQLAVSHHIIDDGAASQFIDALPFGLTGAQQRVIDEVRTDMKSAQPMTRLVQGDVGSGKTAVAVVSLLTAVDDGRQAALVAPTEILATQHFADVAEATRGLTRPDGRAVTVALLTHKNVALSTQPDATRKEVMAALAHGHADITIGTHAVFGQKTQFASLSLVVVDEQHRFGVEQRRALVDKADGVTPDCLYTTATPIPRTAMMTTFGDLDVSVIDEMPPGRTPVATTWLRGDPASSHFLGDESSPAWRTAREQLAQGRQVFVVVPAVESATKEAATAHATTDALRAGALRDYRVGCVTGKDRPADRAATMADFARGDIDVLVATTVIEVGVNVPNASVMVVMGAERFGLAQLHQLRGRVGRGGHAGHCVLLSKGATDAARQRLDALTETTDGFRLAEVDLRIRGGGQVTGPGQAGAGRDLQVADVMTDTRLLQWAKADAREITATDPHLSRHPSLRSEIEASVDEEAARWLLSA